MTGGVPGGGALAHTVGAEGAGQGARRWKNGGHHGYRQTKGRGNVPAALRHSRRQAWFCMQGGEGGGNKEGGGVGGWAKGICCTALRRDGGMKQRSHCE